MKRIAIAAGFLLVTTPLGAQTPSGVAFDVNATEHNSSIVSGYKVYVLAGTNRVRVSDIGKPAPSAGTITYTNSALFTGLSAGSYTVHTTAYGPAGESGSSNKASFSIAGSGGSPAPEPEPSPGSGPVSDGSPGQPSPIVVEAEHFDSGGQGVGFNDLTSGNEGGALRNTAVDVEATTDEGGGHNVGWMAAGEWLDYTVHVPMARTYELQVRVASQSQGGTFHIEVNGRDVTGPMRIPATGSWQVWTTLRKSVSLQAGTQTWSIVLDSPGQNWRDLVGNVNWIRAVPK